MSRLNQHVLLVFAAACLALTGVRSEQGASPCRVPASEPEVPDWAQSYDPFEESNEEATDAYLKNVALAEAANKERRRLDVVMLGDSITAHAGMRHPEVWEEAWAGLDAAPMGVMGNTVEKLAWRLMVGGERLKLSPRVVIINIGVNNLQHGRPLDRTAQRLDALLSWLAAAWPRSTFLLHNLLPNIEVDVGPANELWEGLAAQHGMNFSTCGASIDPWDTGILYDGLHASPEGYRLILPCLRSSAEALVAADRCHLARIDSWAAEWGGVALRQPKPAGGGAAGAAGAADDSEDSSREGSGARGQPEEGRGEEVEEEEEEEAS